MNPIDGTHTNNVENFWTHIKNTFRSMHGVYNSLVPKYLDEIIYRWKRKFDGSIFEMLLHNISTQYHIKNLFCTTTLK